MSARARVNDAHIALAVAELNRRKAEGEIEKTPENFHGRVLRDRHGPYPRQIEILRSIDANRRTSVVGCNGSGKDWEAGRAVLYWIWKWHPEDCKVVITGPTSRQISEIVWREARGAFKAAWKGRLPGKMKPTDPMWEISENTFAMGFSTDKDYTLQGFHSPHLLIIVTEAHGMEQSHIDALRRLNPERFLMTGNAISSAGEFYDSHHAKREIYHTIKIEDTDTPNFRGDLPDVPGLISPEDVEEAKADWGEESPLFRAYAKAEFAADVEGQLISLEWLERSMQPVSDDGSDELFGGVDVAGPGEDETVAGVRNSKGQLIAMRAWSDSDPTAKVAAFFEPYRNRLKWINCDSAGTGYYFAMVLQKLGLPARGVNVGEAPRNNAKFENLKAELYWSLREQFKDGEITGVTDRILQGQLLTVQYDQSVKGKIVIEKKKDAKKRGIRSPDRAEMLMLAYAYVDQTGDGSISMTTNWARGKRSGRRKTEHSHQLPVRGRR